MKYNVSDTFRFKKEEYKNTINPIGDYLDIAATILSKMTNISNPLEAVKKHIKENKLFKNPTVEYYERDLKGNRELKKGDMLSYIRYSRKSGDIMVPSFTVYFSKSKKRSLHSEFIEVNVKERSKHKKLALKYKLEEDFVNFNYHNVIQKVKKIFNNSLSGAYASMGTILNNPSAHYTLTSITRCVSGIGNVISESLISGNRHYRTPDIMIAHVTAIINNFDMDEVKEIAIYYKLHLPTADEVLMSLLKSSSRYWRDIEKESILLEYFKSMTPYERAAVLYHNDLYHLRKYNDKLVRNLIYRLINFDIEELSSEDCDTVMDNADGWVFNLVIHLAIDRLEGKKRSDYTLEDKRYMATAILNLTKILVKYDKLLKLFLVTKVFPPTMAYIKDMVRDAIVLSDTDSTCATYEGWSSWYLGSNIVNNEAVAVSAVIMSMVTTVTDHYIKQFSANMNITYEASQALEMKSEFFWKTFVNTNVSKHYFAGVNVQEGSVYKQTDPDKMLEVKGVGLYNSNAYQPIRDLTRELMVKVITDTNTNKKIELRYFLSKVYEAELMLKDMVSKGSPDVLKMEKIKAADSYKLDGKSSPYAYYTLWQEVFKPKYGSAPDPQYMALKLPTTITSKREMNLFIEDIEDIVLKENLISFMKSHKKDAIKIFRVPLILVHNNGIPKELMSIIDYRRVIRDNCGALYTMLESLGYYVKDKSILLDELDDNILIEK